MQDVWLAAHLAVFNIFLAGSRRGIHAGFIPFATPGALIACVHRFSMVTAKNKAACPLGRAASIVGPTTDQTIIDFSHQLFAYAFAPAVARLVDCIRILAASLVAAKKRLYDWKIPAMIGNTTKGTCHPTS